MGHNKFCVIDEEVVITGSYNWTASAGERNNENLLIIRDEDVAQQYLEEFNRLWSKYSFLRQLNHQKKNNPQGHSSWWQHALQATQREKMSGWSFKMQALEPTISMAGA